MKFLFLVMLLSTFACSLHHKAQPKSDQIIRTPSSTINDAALKKFQTILFDNGNFLIVNTEGKKIPLKKLFLDSLFSDLSINTPQVKCEGTRAFESCTVTWTSAKYTYLRGEKPNDLWRQEDDCVRAFRVEMRASKITSAEMMAEMCGF